MENNDVILARLKTKIRISNGSQSLATAKWNDTNTVDHKHFLIV